MRVGGLMGYTNWGTVELNMGQKLGIVVHCQPEVQCCIGFLPSRSDSDEIHRKV